MNRYSLWRYFLLAALVVIGLIYSVPNWYGDDYAVQVSSKEAVALSTDLGEQISTALNSHQIPYLSIKHQPHSYLIRFLSAENQLKAQDVIQAVLGQKYTVALSLAPKTPKWLQALGAHPMKLGLDLRGGIHFLLNVDINAMLKERLSADVHAMSKEMRDARIRYAGVRVDQQRAIIMKFRELPQRAKAIRLLKKRFPDYEFADVNQGDSFNFQATMLKSAIVRLEQYAVSQNITTLRNRVNELGVAEPVIQQQGKNQISVDLPGIQDTARAKTMIGKVATVRLQLEDTQHDPDVAAKTGVIPFGSTLYKFEGRPILLKNQVILHGSSILNASTITDENGRPAVSVRAGGSGVSLFNKMTAANVGKPLATIYVETKMTKQVQKGKVITRHHQVEKVINVATIVQALGNNFQITGLESQFYAKNLALLLRSGAYIAPVTYVQERLVGPSLGKENIRMGVLSTEIGSLLVIIFMALYYRLFGLIANLALILNVVLVVAVMSILGATMTLPGIAGIVLTVGMAVDANVLINERIREELRNGVSPQASIHAGYERAFSTIVDANVTTLIVALVLFALGTGPVQGFAVTLSIGLLSSMLTAIFFTRAIVNLIYGRRVVKHLSIGIKTTS